MKVFTILLVAVVTSFNCFAYEQNCPIDMGESQENSCAWETAHVKAAVKGLKPWKLHSYCLQAKPGSDGEGVQCRTVTLFKDKEGQVTYDYFLIRFTASEIDRAIFDDIHFVKQENGLYSSYTDRVSDGQINIHRNQMVWRDQSVNFDKVSHLPTYQAKFVYTDGNGQEQIDLRTLTHTHTYADLINDNPGQQMPENTKRYEVLNSPQMEKKK